MEQVWAENRVTVEGFILQERAHDGSDDSRPGERICLPNAKRFKTGVERWLDRQLTGQALLALPGSPGLAL
jgi:hypothetical protein